MASTPAVVLPADYFNTWASEQNPRESGVKSRVTASGFTEGPMYEEPKLIQKQSEMMARLNRYKPVNDKHPEQLFHGEENIHQLDMREDLERSMREMEDSLEDMTNELINKPLKTKKVKKHSGDPIDQGNPFGNEYRTISDFTKYASELSIEPRDSASQFTPFKANKVSRQLKAITEVDSEVPAMSVVGGFNQTVHEKIRELEAYKDISPIIGLPVIFTSPRLNFLTHVHSALFRIITDENGEYPSKNCGDLLIADRRFWNNDPSTQLLETVLDRTIDSKTGIVIANPFCIPILEPTMVITHKLIYMAFDQLHSEFETEWFNTMKSVTTPKFHSKYEDSKFRRSSLSARSKSSSDRRSSSSSTGSSGKRLSSSRGKSVIGSVFSMS